MTLEMESAKSPLRIATITACSRTPMVVHGKSGIDSTNARINLETRRQAVFPHSSGFPINMKFPNELNPASAFPLPVIPQHRYSLGSSANESNPSPTPETRCHIAFTPSSGPPINAKFPNEANASPAIHPIPTDTRIVCFHNLTCLLAGTIAKVEA
jgi:hypothetical protein